MRKLKNMFKKILNIDTFSIAIIFAIFYFLFSFNLFTLISAAIGGVATLFVIHKFSKSSKSKNSAFAIISIIVIYFFYKTPSFIGSFLIGATFISYYFQIKNPEKNMNNSFMNAICLSGIIFASGIEKFRGFNKLEIVDIQITIPLIILIGLAMFFILSLIKSKAQKQILTVVLLILLGGYYLLSNLFFKEIGTGTVFIPLATGTIIGYLQTTINPKTKNIILEINELILLIIIPYQIAGLSGIAFAILGAYIFNSLIGTSLGIEPKVHDNILLKLSPLLFLFAAAEIRENEGLITRFNLITGYQIGWILITSLLINYSLVYKEKLKKILTENEIPNLLAILCVVFTIIAITLIIRNGHDEALASILVSSSIYLFIKNLTGTKGQEDEPLRYVAALGNAIGSIAFLVLSRI